MDTSLLSPILTAIVGYITIRSNIKSNRRNNLVSQKLKEKELNANVISNARIKWLEKVREHTASYIESANLLCYELTMKYDNKRFATVLSNYRKSHFMMKLYFTKTDHRNKINMDHAKIISLLDEIEKEIREQMRNVSKNKDSLDIDKLESVINKFCENISIYFKKVWEEAKDIENAR